jgi:hypothetical protein
MPENIKNPTPEQVQEAMESQRRAVEQHWQKIDLEVMPDKELAQWQAGQKPNSRETVLADQQWRIRLLNRQLRTSRRLAWLGCFSGLLGVVLGYCLHFLDRPPIPATGVLPKQPPDAHAEQKAP